MSDLLAEVSRLMLGIVAFVTAALAWQQGVAMLVLTVTCVLAIGWLSTR